MDRPMSTTEQDARAASHAALVDAQLQAQREGRWADAAKLAAELQAER